MFRTMRRSNQELDNKKVEYILKKGSYGVLAVEGDDGYPYSVPLNYVYRDEKIYFHCAVKGHKIDSIKKNNKVSFCVVFRDDVVPEELTTDYMSVVVFGRAKILDNERKHDILWEIVKKYSEGYEEEGRLLIEKTIDALSVVELEIEHITGKQNGRLASIK